MRWFTLVRLTDGRNDMHATCLASRNVHVEVAGVAEEHPGCLSDLGQVQTQRLRAPAWHSLMHFM